MIEPVLTSGSDFFNADQGGDPAYFQHAFWLLGHPESWLFILILLINFGVMFVLSRQSHFGKALSAIWLGAILYAVVTKFRYFKTMEPIATPQTTLINFIHIGVTLIALFGCLWGVAKFINRQKRSKGLSQK